MNQGFKNPANRDFGASMIPLNIYDFFNPPAKHTVTEKLKLTFWPKMYILDQNCMFGKSVNRPLWS